MQKDRLWIPKTPRPTPHNVVSFNKFQGYYMKEFILLISGLKLDVPRKKFR